VKFTEAGSVEVRVRFEPDAAGGPRLFFDVEDTGIGMTEAQSSQLFEAFAQVDASATRKFGGSGLGLAISRRLARMMGGDVRVKSAAGRGSVFTLEVPTGPVDGPLSTDIVVAPEPGVVAPSREHALAGLRVLLVEDSVDNERLVGHFLRAAGALVEVARDGVEAVTRVLAAAAAAAPFDVTLMDMQMPKLDGYGATAQLRAQGYRGPIVALTAHAMAGDRERCIAAGCDDYLTKPVQRGRMIELVARIAARPRPEQASAGPLLSSLAGDPIVGELLDVFFDETARRVGLLRTAMAEDDRPTLSRVAHTIAGAGGAYGFDLLTDDARGLEAAIDHGEGADRVRAHAEALLRTCERVLGGRSPRSGTCRTGNDATAEVRAE